MKLNRALFALSMLAATPGFAQDITLAPAFTPEALAAPPAAMWATNGGNLLNQRYSPLTQINRENVGELKAHWRAALDGSGEGPRHSAQAQTLFYEGALYTVTGQNDVFAIDVETGEDLWTYRANMDPEVPNLCCGWVSRGLGMGDGKIYLGRIDAKLIALDQTTGEVVWEIQAEDPAAGYSITGAPLYYDGMVITGFAGGEYGIRGHVDAYDADTGELVWRFYTIPGPGEFGHDTWPQDNDAWKYGGAPVWQTPAIDPELGLLIFTTGNPGPDLSGHSRAGDNLFSTSFVALDVKTGEYRWHFQQVHHDIWDYDAPAPVILFDAMIDGELRKGAAEIGKSGYLFILDRTNGEPLIGIPEVPVPQEPSQATSPTQPIPIGDDIVPHTIDIAPEGWTLPYGGMTYTPFGEEAALWKPSSGTNHYPSSYDPDSHLMFICANDSIGGGSQRQDPVEVTPGEQYISGQFARAGVPGRGIYAAVDLRTNRLAWRQQWADRCSSPSAATAGGLVFLGRGDGRMTAINSSDGAMLWEFQTDAAINAPPAVFEWEGVQYVAVLAGGNAPEGVESDGADGVWLFSLEGTMEPLERTGARPGGPGGPAPQAAVVTPAALAAPDRTPDLDSGKLIFTTGCMACHGEDGQGGHMDMVGAPLTKALSIPDIMTTASTGRNEMPSFAAVYTPEQLHDVAAYIADMVKDIEPAAQ
jgi:alcohol dehydrogenase (cytochrome c)